MRSRQPGDDAARTTSMPALAALTGSSRMAFSARPKRELRSQMTSAERDGQHRERQRRRRIRVEDAAQADAVRALVMVSKFGLETN